MGWVSIAGLLVAHAVLGLLATTAGRPIVTAHAWATLAVVLWIVVNSRRVEVFACAAAYVTGAEVFWRMNSASVPWEVAKYVGIVVFAVGVVRFTGRRVRRIGVSVAYVAVLTPSVLVTVERFGLPDALDPISFNVVAHVALAAGAVFFTNLASDRKAVTSVMWVLTAPILTVNAIAAESTLALDARDFNAGLSNTAASGGYGPNQVSALFGLAILTCVFLVLFEHRPQLRVLAAVLGCWFLVQGALTLSRGGLFNVAVALLVAAPFFMRTARYAVRVLGAIAVVGFVIVVVLFPLANSISGGAFEQRFSSGSTTLRTDLAVEELRQFADAPGFGTGVGLSLRSNPFDDFQIPSHTEFSRLLAEHGLLGAVAIVLLVAMAVRGVRDQPLLLGKAFSASCATWALAEMMHSATRLAAVAFVFAFGQVVIRGPGPSPAQAVDRVSGSSSPAPRSG